MFQKLEMIKKIDFASDLFAEYYTPYGNKELDNLNRVNIFIGKNNCGKSRFLRKLFEEENLKLDFYLFNKESISKLLKLLVLYFEQSFDVRQINEVSSDKISGLISTIKELDNKVLNYDAINASNTLIELKEFFSKLIDFKAQSASFKKGVISTAPNLNDITRLVNEKIGEVGPEIQSIMTLNEKLDTHKIYIPILRGLRPVQINEEDHFDLFTNNYKKRTYRDYFKKKYESQSLEIFTGLDLYTETKKMLLGKKEQRNKIKNFEDFLSINFFDKKPVSIIPYTDDDSLHILIDDEERPIYDLGDGIQSIITLFYPLFFNEGKNMLIFIEEPELSLHPGLQRLFIETLLDDRFKTFQYFISTHSNHFLDITLDTNNISVYTFKKLTQIRYEIDNVSNSESNILELLGVRNSSVFLSNCTIWVEGITDRLYIKKILEVYQESLIDEPLKYLEDFHFSFIEYSGSNLVHWAFENSEGDRILANRINQKILLIADRDDTLNNPFSAKAIQLSNIKMILKDNLIVLNVREIENLLSKNVLISTINSLEKNSDLDLNSLVNSINETDYKDVYLGRFIDENILNLKNKYSSESGSGTIKYKDKFCRTALTFIKSVNDLSPDAFDLGVKVFNFIKNSNK